ncbi:phage minor head protein [Thermus sp.]|uniref:phage head morphogenesis protein n=1 Tax=Thermus sp. TaxID=275 RepID=UPI0025DCDDE9|nr:phage minor head protein [Thermus sp.]MDW8358774.1 phage minor head protein [Thermus sp.]
MAWTVEPDPLHPEEALAWFRRRLPLPEPVWRTLREEARRRAFWVAGLAALDMVQETKDALEEALSRGLPFEDFQRSLSERVRTAWGEGSRHRLATVFRTNLQLAYGAGRWKAAEETRSLRPYWGLQVVLDGRTSETCRPLAGVVLPADHPFWRNHIPPLHHGCRTALVTYSREEGERLAWREAPDHAPQEGFGRAPTAEEWSPHPRDYDPILWRAFVTALPQAHPEALAHLRRLAEGGGEAQPDPRDWLWAAGAMGQAPFSRRVQGVPPEERPLLGVSRASSLEIHLRRRFLEKQLSEAATLEAYERLCQETALSPEAALFAYRRNQGPVLAALLPVEWAVPEPLRGPELRGYWLVVYSFWSGTLVTGYAASELSRLRIPWGEVVWLRKPPWLPSLPSLP